MDIRLSLTCLAGGEKMVGYSLSGCWIARLDQTHGDRAVTN
jgi:hypothetical protein